MLGTAVNAVGAGRERQATTTPGAVGDTGRRRRAHVVAAAREPSAQRRRFPAKRGAKRHPTKSRHRVNSSTEPLAGRGPQRVRCSQGPALQGRAAGADNRSVHSAHSKRAEHRERNMHTIAIINAKGGAGKTTLALHLAVADVQQGRNVAVLDLDPQGTAAGWGERRGSSAPVVLATAPSRLGAERERVAGAGADVVYLDTPPRWVGADTAARVAASAADLMVVPVRPSFVDLEATVATLERIQAVTAARVVAVLNGCATRGSDADDAEQALVDRGVEVCPVRIGQRVVFARSLHTGQVAQELEPSGKAAGEIARVHAVLSVHREHTRGTP